MRILLAAATTVEIQPTLDFLLKGDTPRHKISTLITGVGSLPTTWTLMRQIDSDRPDLIIQAGIAGSFTGAPAGQVLVIRDEMLGDLGVWEDGRFKTLFDLRLVSPH